MTQLRFRRTGWTNVVNAFDVTGSENVQSLDALRIINELNDRVHSDPVTGVLRDPILVDPYPGNFYDVNRDGKATALDALRVINYLNLRDADAVSEPLETDLRKPSHSELDASDFVFASMDWLQEGWRKGDVWSNDAVIDDSSKRLF
ncbi:dockerin repeat-containing protein [Rhodopirellula baltica SH28]|uniref:Dockerin repeat-containing protein n=1 Tax=Rhodopirellula baltica SH28 TaxID=993517 RepID=K5DA50_RHOBT|nr:dockerin type I domain-containing protein [Rhodopirellula baltica]EKJ99688.1 dockerin repeat-containing protein [Rhodopirellula baltica SH28]